jgi:ABC-type nitrate/sulfonate/bicarbonate transport system ATPase subunit
VWHPGPMSGRSRSGIGRGQRAVDLLDLSTNRHDLLLQVDIRRMDRATYEPVARHLLRATGLEGFETKKPYELSGGMRQRVSICRALVHDPPLLLMDEPFGALDALTREQISMDIQRLWMDKRKTALHITHSIPEAVLLSDRVVVMSERPGRVARIVDIGLARPRDATVELVVEDVPPIADDADIALSRYDGVWPTWGAVCALVGAVGFFGSLRSEGVRG